MSEYMIALDAMGGDHAPQAACEGAMLAVSEMKDVKIRLYGQKEEIEKWLTSRENIEIVDAREVIDPEGAPIMEVRSKRDSSMVRAAMDLKKGEVQAMVSAGSTGSVLACGAFHVGRIKGVERPALAPLIPGKDKPFLLIDSGANVDCQSKHLLQFGMMGSVYMERVMGVPNPTVGLVNIGVEEDKGSKLYKEAYGLMKRQGVYRFVGNVEAREIPMGQCDVAVADGFDGNLLLKYTEGLSSALFAVLKRGMMSSLRTKIGAMLLKPVFRGVKNMMNYEKHGGAPLLGVNGAMVKAHGSSSAQAFKNAVRQARTMLENHVPEEIRSGVERMSAQLEEGEEK